MRIAWLAALLIACESTPPPTRGPANESISAILDDWHAAAAASDEERYFGHFTRDAIFLGTDVTERWSVLAFRAYSHPHFEAGHGWVMRPVRRAIVVEGDHAWFDEDLASDSLGALRGSGVLHYDGEQWRIAHYNLAFTIPNERVTAVRAAIDGGTPTRERERIDEGQR